MTTHTIPQIPEPNSEWLKPGQRWVYSPYGSLDEGAWSYWYKLSDGMWKDRHVQIANSHSDRAILCARAEDIPDPECEPGREICHRPWDDRCLVLENWKVFDPCAEEWRDVSTVGDVAHSAWYSHPIAKPLPDPDEWPGYTFYVIDWIARRCDGDVIDVFPRDQRFAGYYFPQDNTIKNVSLEWERMEQEDVPEKYKDALYCTITPATAKELRPVRPTHVAFYVGESE